MDSQRNLLIIALLFVSLMIWHEWEQDRDLQQQKTVQTVVNKTTETDSQNISVSNREKQVVIKTDVLKLTVNALGGDVEQVLLLAYPRELRSNEPFQLLETTSDFIYQAQSGLTGRDGPDNPENGLRPLYSVDKDVFVLADDQNELVVPMIYKDTAGNIFTKIFALKRSEYAVNVNYIIENISDNSLELSVFGQLKQSVSLPSYRNTGNFVLNTFRGAAYSTSNKKYEKYKLDTIIDNENLNINSKGGWVAMLQQYFAAAWVPRSNERTNNFYTSNLGDGIAAIGYKSQPVLVQPGQTVCLQSTLWVGPEIQDKMAAVAPHLDLTVDYGWLWFISQPLFKLLKFIHSFLGNWGLSIIAITFIVRSIMYPLTKAQYIAMAKMRTLHPKIQIMRERFRDDKQRISQEIIALYRAEKVNPLSGCFPLLIQMPVFLALYYMLIESVELRHAPFALWIHDLSAQDPYYTLPILMGITMYFIQKMSMSTITDPIQHKIMAFMPIIFTIFFLWFPSGLVLYYVVSNLVTIIQQQFVFHSLKKHDLLHTKKNRN